MICVEVMREIKTIVYNDHGLIFLRYVIYYHFSISMPDLISGIMIKLASQGNWDNKHPDC